MENSSNSYDNETPVCYREFHETSFDDVSSANSYDNVEPVYRGVLAVHNNHLQTLSHVSTQDSGNYLQKPTLQRENVKQNNTVIFNNEPKTHHKFKAAELPDILMATHFSVHHSLDVIVSLINTILGDTNGASYKFDESKCEWTVIYLYGSSHVKFQLFVYYKDTNDYIVEGNRLMGDGFSFRNIFEQVKEQLSCSPNENSRRFNDISNSMHIPIPPVYCEEDESDEVVTADCFENIFRMARETTIEAQLEASRMLCDLTADTSGMQQAVVDNGGLVVLRELVEKSLSDWAKQHAMFALANLSDAKVFESAIMKEGAILPLLIKHATDGQYNTAEMRRSAAHILATLCDGCPSDVVRLLGKSLIVNWMNTVDNIKDEKLKLHACRAKSLLAKVPEIMTN